MTDAARPLCTNVAHMWDEGLMLTERTALCELAHLPKGTATMRWSELSTVEASTLFIAFRRAVSLGSNCANALLQDAVGPRE